MKKLTKITLVSALMLLSGFVFAQSTVSGTVTDADMNAPLPGANVVKKGQQTEQLQILMETLH